VTFVNNYRHTVVSEEKQKASRVICNAENKHDAIIADDVSESALGTCGAADVGLH
jgi:tetraacyldisaccharide-1-P 4'-kinase